MGKWIKCKKCGHEYFSTLSKCPNCSSVTVNFKLVSSILSFVAVLTVAVIGIILGFGSESDNKLETVNSNSSVADDSINSKTEDEDETESKREESSNISSASKESESSEKENNVALKIGAQRVGDNCYITVPKTYLKSVYDLFALKDSGVDFDEFAYTLSSDDKSAGFTEAKKNSDGSATKIIPYGKYNAMLTKYAAGILQYSIGLKKLEFVEDIENSSILDSFDIKLKKNKTDLSDSEFTQIIMLGVLSLEKQYYSVDSKNSSVIKIEFLNGETETLIFPDTMVN